VGNSYSSIHKAKETNDQILHRIVLSTSHRLKAKVSNSYKNYSRTENASQQET